MGKTLITVSLWSLCGALLGSWLGPATGWAVFALGLLLMVMASGLQLSRISRWVKNIDDPPPASVGPWDEILAPIYRKLKQNRHELQERSRTLQRVLLAAEALPDGALTLGPDKTLLWCNQTAAEHLGLDPGQDLGHSILNILRAPEFAEYATRDSWDGPLNLTLRSGPHVRKLLLHLAPYGAGQFLIVTRDITDIERMVATRKRFISKISQRLSMPVAVLAGFIDTLMHAPDNSLDTEQQKHHLQLMAQETRSLQKLVNSLAQLAEPEASLHTAHAHAIDMHALIHQAVEQHQQQFRGQHRWTCQLDPALQIRGQKPELISAIDKLIFNACRLTPAGGSIQVSWNLTDSGEAQCCIQDTGLGMHGQDLGRLAFFAENQRHETIASELGLDLAIVHQVASHHQARLEVDSAPGTGSCFTLSFPIERVCKNSADAQQPGVAA